MPNNDADCVTEEVLISPNREVETYPNVDLTELQKWWTNRKLPSRIYSNKAYSICGNV